MNPQLELKLLRLKTEQGKASPTCTVSGETCAERQDAPVSVSQHFSDAIAACDDSTGADAFTRLWALCDERTAAFLAEPADVQGYVLETTKGVRP